MYFKEIIKNKMDFYDTNIRTNFNNIPDHTNRTIVRIIRTFMHYFKSYMR